jgi:D-amino-acid dehydrogenase
MADTDVCIIGGGVIGLCSAYYLSKAGYGVTVIERHNLDRGASHVNAGYVTPSHIIPLASPGMPAKGLKYMFNPESPFYLKPRMELDLVRWSWLFYRNATPRHVERCAPVLLQFNEKSKALYEEMAMEEGLSFGYARTGLLKLCQTPKKLESDKRDAEFSRNLGLDARELSRQEVHDMEPRLPPQIIGAIYYADDALLIPQDFMLQLRKLLEQKGVNILTGRTITEFFFQKGVAKGLKTKQEGLSFSSLVIAAGVWSSYLLKLFGMKMPMQAGKGYCFEIENPGIRYPAILSEANAAISPMGNKLRFAGTMELAGLSESITLRRVRAIKSAAEKYYPGIRIPDEALTSARSGLRPVSPDGMPYIGQLADLTNVFVATGHAMMGMSLGPATGKLISDMILQRPLSIDVSHFTPGRFS